MLPVAINHIHIQGTASVITACFDVNSSITILSQPSVKEGIMKSTDSKKLFFTFKKNNFYIENLTGLLYYVQRLLSKRREGGFYETLDEST